MRVHIVIDLIPTSAVAAGLFVLWLIFRLLTKTDHTEPGSFSTTNKPNVSHSHGSATPSSSLPSSSSTSPATKTTETAPSAKSSSIPRPQTKEPNASVSTAANPNKGSPSAQKKTANDAKLSRSPKDIAPLRFLRASKEHPAGMRSPIPEMTTITGHSAGDTLRSSFDVMVQSPLSLSEEVSSPNPKASFLLKKNPPFRPKHEVFHPVQDAEIHYSHCSSKTKLVWQDKPKTVFIVKKWKDSDITNKLDIMAAWLTNECKIRVLVEPSTHDELPHLESYESYSPELLLEKKVDFIICLGGDGTILHAVSLLKKSVPPIMAFHLGSMGFLSYFDFAHFKTDIQRILEKEFTLQLRNRLICKVYRAGSAVPDIQTQVLNEVVVDRGDIPSLLKLDCFCDNRRITTIQADGIIIATATGSTAYSLSAGASVVHPLVPGILFTPICPHALSARPLVFPDSATLEIRVPKGLRGQPKVCFDGRGKMELFEEDRVVICVSSWPVPQINKTDDTTEWIRSLGRCLHWNQRIEQK